MMKIKNVLLIALIMQAFSPSIILPAQNDQSGSAMAILVSAVSALAGIVTIVKEGQTVAKQQTEQPNTILQINSGHLNIIKETQATLAAASMRKGYDPAIKKEQEKNDKELINFNRFIM